MTTTTQPASFLRRKKIMDKVLAESLIFFNPFSVSKGGQHLTWKFYPKIRPYSFSVAKGSLTIIASNDIRDFYYSWVSRFVADLTKAPESTVGSSPNVSLNCLNNIHSSFYLTWYFSKSPQSQQSFGILLQTQICCQDLSKTPIRVGLTIGSITVTMTLAS